MKHFLIGLSAIGLLATLPMATFAHTALASSNIEAGAALTVAPDTLDLTFGKSVGLAKLELVTAGSNNVQDITPAREMRTLHRVDLPRLKPGAYTIQWRAVAGDGHVMSGEIAFTITDD